MVVTTTDVTVTASTPTTRRYASTSWDLSDLLPEPSDEVIAQETRRLEEAVEEFAAARTRLRPDMRVDDLLELLRQYEHVDNLMQRLTSYGNLWFSSNTQSSAALSFRNRTQQLVARLQNRILFFELWWKSLDDVSAERLLPPLESEPDYHHFLSELRRFRPYSLDERSEQIINVKDTNGISAILTLYSMLTNRLEFRLEEDGETRSLTEDEMRSRFFSPDPKLRAATCQELFRVYAGEANVLAQIYANRVRDWHAEQVELRGFSSAISVRNLWNDVPDAAVATLLDVIKDNAPLFQEYFKLKAGWLGLDRLRRYDLYAPLATSEKRIPFGDAAELVLDTFRRFDPHFAGLAERVFEENHFDSEIRKGKRGGAYCSTVLPSLTPWVMMNFAGRMRDVATLAHELGHAVHSQLANHHSAFTQHPSLPLAETASVFSEMLITDRLLAAEHHPVTRRELLASALDDIYATVMRQAYFVRFEIAAHEAVIAGKSADDLIELYSRNLVEQFGDSMDISGEFRYEWLSIPHLYRTPFYCYAYSFGQLLVLALYRRYKAEGAAFKPGYFRLLSTGGCGRPADMLAELDIDVTDPAFWQQGFEVVREMLAELKSLDIT